MISPNLAPPEEGEQLEEANTVGIIFEDANGNILVLKRLSDEWGLVGGKVNPGEDSQAAAVREASEEIGYSVTPSELSFKKIYRLVTSEGDFAFGVFKYTVPPEQIGIKLKQDENTESMWAKPEQLHKRPDLMEGLYPILEEEFGLEPAAH